MTRHASTAAASLIAITALLALPAGARAGCTPAVKTDAQYNICIGTGALLGNRGGGQNTAMGHSAFRSNVNGSDNTAIGYESLFSNTEGVSNTAVGRGALRDNTLGNVNTAIGYEALRFNTIGHSNAAFGFRALRDNTVGFENVAFGSNALVANVKGHYNTAIGDFALWTNIDGIANTAIGKYAGSVITGDFNTAVGFGALGDGSDNTAVGVDAGGWYEGTKNIALGFRAGRLQRGDVSNNIAIGSEGENGDNAVIRIGTKSAHSRTFIQGVFGGAFLGNFTGGQAVLVNVVGELGTSSSGRRYKQDIQPMEHASDALMQLQPVTFHYKQADENGQRPLQYGLIAEDVAEAMPDMVIRNAAGAPESVAYQTLPSLLLNEFQKQNREIVEVGAQLDGAQAELAAAKADVESLKLLVSRLAAAAPLAGSDVAASR